MLSNNYKKRFTVLGFCILSVLSITAYADLLLGPPSDIEVGGAEAVCGLYYPGQEVPIIDEGLQTASCNAFERRIRASSDLPNGEVKVYVSSPAIAPLPNSEEAYGVFVDLITVTDGWDENGEVSGTFELEVDGTVDVGGEFNETFAAFYVIIWRPSDPTPPCLYDTDDCGIYFEEPITYDYGEVNFDLDQVEPNTPPDVLEPDAYGSGTGYGFVASGTDHNVRATVTVPWTVTQAEPSYYVAVVALAAVSGANQPQGTADFFNTAKGNLRGPIGFQYTSRNGFGSNLASLPPVVDGPVTLNGNVETENVETGEEIPVCAMVLASGQYMFSCDPQSQYALNDLPRETNGTVTRQVYADGFFPVVKSLLGSTTETVVMTPSSNCPNYNFPSSPDVNTGATGNRKSISGRVLVRDTEIPVCAMVLANGSYMFSCDGSGNYSLEFPLDANGQFQLQVYADGFAPVVQTFDESDIGGDVRMAPSAECQEFTDDIGSLGSE